MTTATNAARRPDIEAELSDKYHVDYTIQAGVDPADIDLDASLANQARLFEPVNEETVQQYQDAIERGDVFPGIIAYRPGRKVAAPLVIIDGNHRALAYKRAGKPIPVVYEVDRSTRRQTISVMTYAFNARHGRGLKEAEAVHHALWLIKNGASQTDAASTVNLRMAVLRKALAKATADDRAREVGIDPRFWDSLPDTSRARLTSITTDEGFHGAAELVAKAGLNVGEIMELVQTLNSGSNKSAIKQRRIIEAETERYRDRIQGSAGGIKQPGAGGNRQPASPRAHVARVMGQVRSLPDDVESLADSWAEAERKEGARMVMDGARKLMKLAKAIDPTVK